MGVLPILVANLIAAVVLLAFLFPGILGQANQTLTPSVIAGRHQALSEEVARLRQDSQQAVCVNPETGNAAALPDSADVEKRLAREGVQSGSMRVSLAWNGEADLDLKIICPSGETIFHNKKEACGGKLDVDANSSNAVQAPVENITWGGGAAQPGEYQVVVDYFRQKGASQKSLPFVIDAKIGGETQQFSGTVECCKKAETVGTLVVPGTEDRDAASSAAEPTQDAEAPADTQNTGTPEQPALPPIAPIADSKDEMVENNGEDMPLVELLERSVVMVVTPAASAGSANQSIGSGFLIDERRIVTNQHVVGNNSEVMVVNKRLGRPTVARVIATTPGPASKGQPDFALLVLGEASVELAALPIARNARKMQRVVSAGYPGFLLQSDADFQRLLAGDNGAAPELILNDGIVRRPVQASAEVPFVLHSADIAQGNSGGPLVDVCGQVLGVNTLVSPVAEQSYSVGWALASEALLTFLSSHDVTPTATASPCAPQHIAAAANPGAGSTLPPLSPGNP